MKKQSKRNKIAMGLVISIPLAASAASLLTITSCSDFGPDTKVVKQINEILDKQSPKTMSDVIDVLKSNNIDLLSMIPSNQEDQFVWDSLNNKVVVIQSDGTLRTKASKKYTLPEPHYIWKMVKGEVTTNTTNTSDFFAEHSEYSQYLRNEGKYPDALHVTAGLDMGTITTYKEIFLLPSEKETAPQSDIVINTISASLSITTNFKEVKHYGYLKELTVEKNTTDTSSFNEYGTIVGNATLSAGSFVAEPTSIINTIIVDSNNVKKISVKGEGTNSASVGTIAKTENVTTTMPEIIIDVPEEKKPDQPKKPVVPPTPESGDLQGLGTEKSPYILTKKEDFKKIHEYISKGYCWYKYVSTTMEIDGSDWEQDYFGNLYGSFDGSGLVVNNLSRPLFNIVGTEQNPEDTEIYTISNVTLNCKICTENSTSGLVRTMAKNGVFENVQIHGYIAGSNYVGSFVGFGPGNMDLKSTHTINWEFNNCTSDAILTSTGTVTDKIQQIADVYAGGIIGYAFAKTDGSFISLKDTYFNGYISTNTSFTEEVLNSKYGYFTSGTMFNSYKVKTEYTDVTRAKLNGKTPEELGFYAVPDQKDEDGTFYVGHAAPTGKEDFNTNEGYSYAGHRSYIKSDTVTEPGTKAQILTGIDKDEETTSAIASLFISPNNTEETGSFTAPFLTEQLDVTGTTLSTVNVKNYKIVVNDGIHPQGVDNDTYYINDGETFYGQTYSGAFILITQYKQVDGVNVPIHVTSCQLSK